MFVEEGAVSTIEDIDFWVCECRVLMCIICSVLMTDEPCSKGYISSELEKVTADTYAIGARWAEYSQWNISSVL